MFRFQNARGTGAHDDGDAMGPIPLLRFRHCDHESILLQPEPGQPVIATVESLQFIPERKILQPFDSSDVGLECDIFEVAECQSRSPLAQGLEDRAHTASICCDKGKGR